MFARGISHGSATERPHLARLLPERSWLGQRHFSMSPTMRKDDMDPAGPDELVGPGRFPLRIQPAAAVAPGTSDARRLLAVWYVRKSFYWLFFLGLIIGISVALVRDEGDTSVDIIDPGQFADNVISPWALVIIALVLRLVVAWVALALTAPLVFAHEPNLSPRDNFGSGIGVFFDRLHVARAFRALRWTHHVRQVALGRLGPTGDRLRKLDPVLDVVNITMGVLVVVVPVAVAAAIGS
jgi:hypothetical protein